MNLLHVSAKNERIPMFVAGCGRGVGYLSQSIDEMCTRGQVAPWIAPEPGHLQFDIGVGLDILKQQIPRTFDCVAQENTQAKA